MSFTDNFKEIELPIKINTKADLKSISKDLETTSILALEALIRHGHYVELMLSTVSGTVELYGKKVTFQIGSENFYLGIYHTKFDFSDFVLAVKESIIQIERKFS